MLSLSLLRRHDGDSYPVSAFCNKTIVLLHYAPVTDTLVGEPETIWTFSGQVAWPGRSARTGRIWSSTATPLSQDFAYFEL